MMALKIAKLLENADKCGKVILIDGSPKFIHQLSSSIVSANQSDEFLQEIILKSCIKLLFRESAQEVMKKIFTSNSSIESKLETFLTHAKDFSTYSVDYGRKMINALTKRLKISLNSHKISFSKLEKSTLTLIKPSEMTLVNFDEDYGLKNYIKNDTEMDIKKIEGDHISILKNSSMVEYVNQVID